ncbi:4Fe-4S ferredoxin, iron-sulfur binding domain-containing protein [Clostridium aceticum]|uniref:4Fe-4S ferredoxin, iron-sulfur binding domain-containing protein n=1 Tax=Clostridium aceticum TaxID=84022 RepID=A0A0D8IA56_9CLOT|nr:4Fe-4S binding protein [Clostridium aceticum]AKL94263.1 4Fe-4S ferredoxin, iron-sulfur binding domain-containing protein [Clostridium aceticum]KJF26111.1 4Fe-4S ferredoxin [Clostridium aceticum]
MAVRKIIEINEEKCDGCGLCVPNCAEGAIQIIDGKAKLVSDIYCDGLGACLGHCPQDALKIIEREAPEFDEEAVEELLKQQGKSTPQPHNHQHHHGGGCPGSRMMKFDEENTSSEAVISSGDIEIKIKPQLKQWPVQLKLVPVNAPYFENADLLVTADCVPFAYPNYHLDLLKGKAVVVGCPKLDDIEFYTDKLAQIIASNHIKSVTVAYMEVPCCQGIVRAVDIAVAKANKAVKVNKVKISLQGQKL